MKVNLRISLSLSLVLAGTWVQHPGDAIGQGRLAVENCDTNGDSQRDLSDGVYSLSWLFLGGPAPVAFDCPGDQPALDNGDCNGDNARDLSDVVWLLTGLFIDSSVRVAAAECPDVGDVLYVGSLTRTRGRWTYLGQPGPAGAEAFCAQQWPGSSVCTWEKLQAAEASGELVNAVDFDGNAVTSFWVTNPDASPERQCWNTAGESVAWSYATAHLGVRGEFVILNQALGTLSAISLDNRCRDSHWVPCCNP